MESMTQILLEWNRSAFGNIFRRKRLLLASCGVRKILAKSNAQRPINLDAKLRKDLDETLKQEEISFQKSREEWIKSGDLNTKFYHAATMIRRRRNRIEALKNDSRMWIDDQKKMQNLVRNYFKG